MTACNVATYASHKPDSWCNVHLRTRWNGAECLWSLMGSWYSTGVEGHRRRMGRIKPPLPPSPPRPPTIENSRREVTETPAWSGLKFRNPTRDRSKTEKEVASVEDVGKVWILSLRAAEDKFMSQLSPGTKCAEIRSVFFLRFFDKIAQQLEGKQSLNIPKVNNSQRSLLPRTVLDGGVPMKS
ncbi:hypothetical protein HZH66_009564 [Vespula vulgaris]|uniref:Uncharacterized protein n=1 Tax=Vespula vulgaris TaxID=7454 RepID=A0A834N116_VESVU|nr:hypothetical protein HZH66_009564 [Vespula vulgaris]